MPSFASNARKLCFPRYTIPIHHIGNLLFAFPHHLGGLQITHTLKIGQVESLPVIGIQPLHAQVQRSVALPGFDHFLNQCLLLRLLGQVIQAEAAAEPAFVPQRHVPRRLIQICFQAACPNPGLLVNR